MNTPLTAPAQHDLDRQRDAIAALGAQMRELVDAVVRTEAPAETLHHVAATVRELTAELSGTLRTPGELPLLDDFPAGVRTFSPVTGVGSPLAPPLRVEPAAEGLVGHCTLGIAHEGPPAYGHGGMSALLLDELMGHACIAAGVPAMTVSLTTSYRRPVPVRTPLRLTARVVGADGRKVTVEGTIATEADPGEPLVTASGVFVTPDLDRARALFARSRPASATPL